MDNTSEKLYKEIRYSYHSLLNSIQSNIINISSYYTNGLISLDDMKLINDTIKRLLFYYEEIQTDIKTLEKRLK